MTGGSTRRWSCGLLLALPTIGVAQPAFVDRPIVLSGRVTTPDLSIARGDVLRDSSGMRPVPATWVVLHRVVGADGGPVDSVRTDARGMYRLSHLQRAGDSARFFASTTFAGMTYFTAASAAGHVHEGDGDLAVFDTTSTPFPLAVRGRHLIVRSADQSGQRTVIEVFELSNDSARTLLAREGAEAPPTFRTALPSSAVDVRAGEGDISAAAIRVHDGEVLVTAPFAPGIKQLAFSYLLPARDGALEIETTAATSVLEVLLEDSTASAGGARLRPVDAVTIDGRRFRRSLAQDLPAGERIRVLLPVAATAGMPLNGIALTVGAGAFALLLLVRRSARRQAVQPSPWGRDLAGADLPTEADALAREIAALDARYAALSAPDSAMQSAYAHRRRELKDALAVAMSTPSTRERR